MYRCLGPIPGQMLLDPNKIEEAAQKGYPELGVKPFTIPHMPKVRTRYDGHEPLSVLTIGRRV
jgi:hypothetical protein